MKNFHTSSTESILSMIVLVCLSCLTPAMEMTYESIRKSMPELYATIADESKPLGEKIKIVKLLKQASKGDLGITNGGRLIGDAYYYQAKICLLPETITKELGVNPIDYFALCQKAVDNGSTIAGIEAGKRVLANKGDDVQVNLAIKLLFSAVNSSRRIPPEQKADAYCVLGDLYLQSNNKDKAKEAYQKAAAISPESIRGKPVDGNQADVPEKARVVQIESITKLKETEKSIAVDKDNETAKLKEKGNAYMSFNFYDPIEVVMKKIEIQGLLPMCSSQISSRIKSNIIFSNLDDTTTNVVPSTEPREASNDTFYANFCFTDTPAISEKNLLYRISVFFFGKKVTPKETSDKILKAYPDSKVEEKILPVETKYPGIVANLNLNITTTSTDEKHLIYTYGVGYDFVCDQKAISSLQENNPTHKALMNLRIFETETFIHLDGKHDVKFKSYLDMVKYLIDNYKTDPVILTSLEQYALGIKSINSDLEISCLVVTSKKITDICRKANEDASKKKDVDRAEREKSEKAKALDL